MTESCPFHQKGHCKNKSKCALNHNIPNCNMGLFCKNKNSCTSRHVRACNLLPNCPYKKCSYSHNPIAPPLLPFQPPIHPPHPYSRSPPILPDPSLYCRRIQDLESQVYKLSKEVLAISTKLATEVYGSSNETEVIEKHDLEVGKDCLNITKEPDLESVLTNQQEDVNIENCSKTNKNTKWWPWSKQKQSGKSSDDDFVYSEIKPKCKSKCLTKLYLVQNDKLKMIFEDIFSI